MKDMMTHRGYFGSVHYDDDDRLFYGKMEFINASVSYEGTDVESLRRAFEEAVDDYLSFCQEQGRQPEKPFKGSFNVRITPELHQKLVKHAITEGIPLNTYVKAILEKAVA